MCHKNICTLLDCMFLWDLCDIALHCPLVLQCAKNWNVQRFLHMLHNDCAILGAWFIKEFESCPTVNWACPFINQVSEIRFMEKNSAQCTVELVLTSKCMITAWFIEHSQQQLSVWVVINDWLIKMLYCATKCYSYIPCLIWVLTGNVWTC